jgi:hypothetical protein
VVGAGVLSERCLGCRWPVLGLFNRSGPGVRCETRGELAAVEQIDGDRSRLDASDMKVLSWRPLADGGQGQVVEPVNAYAV